LLEQAIAEGHAITALVRDAAKLATDQPNLTVIVGDATNQEDVAKAVAHADVVVSVLGGASTTLMTKALQAVVSACKAVGVPRVILMSSFMVRRERLGVGTRLLTGLAMAKYISDKAQSEALLRSSGLQWTVVYAGRLANGPRTGKAREARPDETVTLKNSVSRADVAAWLLVEAVSGHHVRSDVLITS
jgi:putative NADH-flavin reductase